MTGKQKVALSIIYARGGDDPAYRHVSASDIGRKTLNSLIQHKYISVNNDHTVTLTETGLLAVLHAQKRLGA